MPGCRIVAVVVEHRDAQRVLETVATVDGSVTGRSRGKFVRGKFYSNPLEMQSLGYTIVGTYPIISCPMNILGINAFHGDASAVLCQGRRARRSHRRGASQSAKAQRWLPVRSRRRRSSPDRAWRRPRSITSPCHAIRRPTFTRRSCSPSRSASSFTKLVKDRLANVAKVRGLDDSLATALGVEAKKLRAKYHNVEHHKSHLASAFFAAPADEAACLSIDGFGDFLSTMRAVGRGLDLEILDRVEFPHSSGLFYTAGTQFLGFHKFGEEWKMMGLAPYGKPTYVEKLRQVIRPVDGGHFELNLDYFRHHTDGVEMTWDDGSPQLDLYFSPKLAELRARARDPEDPEFFGKWAISRTARRWCSRRSSSTCSTTCTRARASRRSRSRGRLRAELRRQRPDLRAHALSRGVRSAGRGRQRDRDRRGLLRRAQRAAAPAHLRHDARLHGARASADDEVAAAIEQAREQRLGREHRRASPRGRRSLPRGRLGDDGGQGRGVVPGQDGVRPPRARQPL